MTHGKEDRKNAKMVVKFLTFFTIIQIIFSNHFGSFQKKLCQIRALIIFLLKT